MRLDYKFQPNFIKEIYYINHKRRVKGFRCWNHKHALGVYEIVFVDYGKIHLEIDKKPFDLPPGECIFIGGDTNHFTQGRESTSFSFLNIKFRGEIPHEIVKKPLKVNHEEYNILAKIINASINKTPHSYELIACYLTEFIVSIMERHISLVSTRSIPNTINIQHYQSEIVQRAMSVIANEYSTHLTLERVSAAVGVSESHLRALIRKETGKNFTSILHSQRIAVAKHFLASVSYSIEEVASAVGYISLPFFFKVFKRYTGMTPKTYASSLRDIDKSE